jgi:heme acquisition protein HasR
MVRLTDGVGKYANGQKTSGSLFVGGRFERWDFMLGAAKSENEFYRIGSRISDHALMNDAHAINLHFNDARPILNKVQLDAISLHDNCRYYQVKGRNFTGGTNCAFNREQAKWLKEAAKKPLPGTQKQTESQMLRLRHYLNDAYDQRLELFAASGSASYETDQEPYVQVPLAANPSDPGDKYHTDRDAYWGDSPFSVRAELESRVIGLKYSGAFSKWINPEVQLYHEEQDRKQRWTSIYYKGMDMHYFVDVGSNGLKLSNASHFEAALAGALRLDVGLELRKTDKKVDDLIDSTYQALYVQNPPAKPMVFDPDSRVKSTGFSLALSTEGKGPWQASAGVGIQRQRLDVLNPTFETGNVKQGGTLCGRDCHYSILSVAYRDKNSPLYLVNTVINPDTGNYYTNPEARAKALADAAILGAEEDAKHLFDPSLKAIGVRRIEGKQKHHWDLKSANFALQYTHPGSGLTTYGSVGYGERAPTSNEMYMFGEMYKGHFGSNPDLKPEKNLSLQLGMNYRRSNWFAARDALDVGIGLYRNRIRNYMLYGQRLRNDEAIDLTWKGKEHTSGNTTVNDVEPFIRQGVELNLGYQQPRFYVRGNLTLPIRHDNKICYWQSPTGRNYYKTTDTTTGATVLIPFEGKGEKICASSWNWAEAGAIEPIRGSLTAALTPLGGKLELGGTLHYRDKQRAAYWYDKSTNTYEPLDLQNQQKYSKEGVPSKDKFIELNLWPRVIKLDLFVSYRVSDQLRASLYLANVTDRMDATLTAWGYSFYPGRTLTATLEYRF